MLTLLNRGFKTSITGRVIHRWFAARIDVVHGRRGLWIIMRVDVIGTVTELFGPAGVATA